MSKWQCTCSNLTDGARCAVCFDNQRITHSNQLYEIAKALGFTINVPLKDLLAAAARATPFTREDAQLLLDELDCVEVDYGQRMAVIAKLERMAAAHPTDETGAD